MDQQHAAVGQERNDCGGSGVAQQLERKARATRQLQVVQGERADRARMQYATCVFANMDAFFVAHQASLAVRRG